MYRDTLKVFLNLQAPASTLWLCDKSPLNSATLLYTYLQEIGV